jgi:hypothetical protein
VPEPVSVPETPVETAAPAAVLCAVGFTSDPPISEAARTANANALRVHGPEHYEESERGFAAAIALAPNYRGARFNHACALSRLNRLDEAWSELMPLLCEDLPTYGPRLAEDEDLAALREREGSHIAETLRAMADRYRVAAGTGTPLTAFEHGPARADDVGTEWEESQAGVYLPAEHRFLPMGPRLRERGLAEPSSGTGGYALNATRYFPERARVLAILARGSDAEGGPELGPVEVRLYEAATGNPLFTHRFSAVAAWVTGSLENENAVVVGYEDLDDQTHFRIDIDGTGGRRTRGATPATGVLSAGGVTWEYVQSARLPAEREASSTLELEDGRVVTLGPAPRGGRWVRTTSQRDVVLVVTERRGECEVRDRHEVERMVLSTGERTVVHAGDGYAIIEEGTDGALYIQVGDDLHRFPNLGSGTGEVLWPGLGITSMANDFNPNC